jgi:hypothetical protein
MLNLEKARKKQLVYDAHVRQDALEEEGKKINRHVLKVPLTKDEII